MSPPTSAKAHDARGVRNRARIGQPLACLLERRELLLEPVVLVGARKMRHQAERGDGVALREPLDQRGHVTGPYPQSVHAGVDLEEHFERALEMRMLEHRHLVRVMDDGCQASRGELWQLVGGKEALEQQDSARVVRGAERERGIELEQREAVGISERRQHAQEPVAVGIGLDHGQHLRVRRALAHERQVPAERGKVDLGKQRAGHGAATMW